MVLNEALSSAAGRRPRWRGLHERRRGRYRAPASVADRPGVAVNDLPKREPPSPKWFLAAVGVLIAALVGVKVGGWMLDSKHSPARDASADPIAARRADRPDRQSPTTGGDRPEAGSPAPSSTSSSSAAALSTASSSPTTTASSTPAGPAANGPSTTTSPTMSSRGDGAGAGSAPASPAAPTSLDATRARDLVSQWVDISIGASPTATGAPDLDRLAALETPEFAARSIPALRAFNATYRWQVVTPSQWRLVVTSVSGSASAATVQTCVFNDDWLVARASGRVVTNTPRTERTTWQLTRDATGTWRIADASTPDVTLGGDTCPR